MIRAPFQAPATPPKPPAQCSERRDSAFGQLYDLPPCKRLADEELREIARAMTSKEPAPHRSLSAAYTYFGQLVAHDVTGASIASDALRYRTPFLDLDAIYGLGPLLQPYLYDEDWPGRLLLSSGVSYVEYDLPRNPQRLALSADPRNDETVLLSQMTVLFLRFHNWCVRQVEENTKAADHGVFPAARRLARWHYQWIVLHDYLPRILHPETRARLFGGADRDPSFADSRLLHYSIDDGPWVPLEFAAAAFRFGHSLVREGYHLNAQLKTARHDREVPLFSTQEKDLRGGEFLPADWKVDWPEMMLPGGVLFQTAGAIDTRLARPLGAIPLGAGVTLDLAYVDLQLGQRLGLPCGQDLAREMGSEDVLCPEETGLDGSAALHTPLWYYILRESEVRCGGETLGRVGSEIVAEVLLGLIRADPDSYLRQVPTWRPQTTDGAFDLCQLALAAYAG